MPETVTIIMTTYFPSGEDGLVRASIAQAALVSWKKYLQGANLKLHIADDGSTEQPVCCQLSTFGFKPTMSNQDRHGVGASLNAGFRQAFTQGDFVLYLVDDWKLNAPFDLSPWIKLLDEDPRLGMIRFGPPHPDLTGTFVHDDDRWYIRLNRHHFAFGFRPALFHRRMLENYGPFDEDCNAYDCERLYSERFNQDHGGPDIAYALPYPFEHLYGGVELAGINPRGT